MQEDRILYVYYTLLFCAAHVVKLVQVHLQTVPGWPVVSCLISIEHIIIINMDYFV